MNGLAMLGTWSAVGAAIAVVVGWGPLQIWLETHEKLAAWVQAVGSVAAIWLAMWVVQRQHGLEQKRQLEAEAREQIALNVGALHLLSAAFRLAEKVTLQRNEHQLNLLHMCIELEGVANALARVDILRFDTHLTIEALLVAESAAKTLLGHMQAAHAATADDGHPRWGPLRQFAEQTMALTKPRADMLHDSIAAAQKALRDG